jgi:hypothetical protein
MNEAMSYRFEGNLTMQNVKHHTQWKQNSLAG